MNTANNFEGGLLMRFGFVGLGQMGAPMAINLAKAYNVTIFDSKKKTMLAVAGKRASPLDRPNQFSEIDALILSLPDAATVQHVLFDPRDGFARYLKRGTIIIDTGTTEYEATLIINKKLNMIGLHFLDAPVSGMRARAKDASLSMMLGGDTKIFRKVEKALSQMASKIIHMGPVGTGQLTKLVNQLLFDINMAGLAEILPMAVKLGLNPDQVTEIINSGTGRSYASEFFLPNIMKGEFEKGYPMQAAYKDLISGAKISSNYKIPTPVLAAATTSYQKALLEGHGEKDKGGMILVYERLLDVVFRHGKSKK